MSTYHVVRTLVSPDKQWRAEIVRRPGGTFGFRVFKLHIEDVGGPHWDMVSTLSEAVVATADEAERELRSRVAELADAIVAAA